MLDNFNNFTSLDTLGANGPTMNCTFAVIGYGKTHFMYVWIDPAFGTIVSVAD